MKNAADATQAKQARIDRQARLEHGAEGAAGGAITGAALGAIAGPAGMAAGAIMGAVAGIATAVAIDDQALRERAYDEKIDAQIGVEGGELGAPNLEHPPAHVGAYSSASAGGNSAEEAPTAEGPIQPPED